MRDLTVNELHLQDYQFGHFTKQSNNFVFLP